MTAPLPSTPSSSAAGSLSLKVEGLAVSAGNSGHELLKDISLSVKPGEFVCVLGPSGAGKTTLVRTLLGQVTPSSGEIRFGSLRVSGDSELLNGLIGYVPQKEIVHDELPVGRALKYAAKLRLPPSLSQQEIAERIHGIEKDVGIAHLHETPVGNLSGGESKRVSLAVELLSFPRILIVDEATSSLDPASDARIMHLLAEYAKKYSITLLCITHHLENAKLADRLLILASGHLVWSGGVKEALDHFGVHRLSQIYLLLEDQPIEQWVGLHRAVHPRESAAAANDETPGEAESLQPAVRSGWLRQFSALLQRGLEVLFRDRRSLAFLIGVPLLMVAFAYVGFAKEHFGQKAIISRPLKPNEIQLVGQLWGQTLRALALSESDESEDITVPAQIRVFLDKEPGLQERLRSPETAQLVKRALAGGIPVVPEKEITDPWPTWQFRFTVLFGMLILGFLAGLTEIVKERPILERESANGVRTSAYIASKFVLLGVVLAIQIVPSVCLLQGLFRLAAAGSHLGALEPFLLVGWLSAMVCAGIGLAISGLVKTREQALLTLPLLLLPQLVLCSMLIRLTGGALTTVAKLCVPAFWAFRGTIDYVTLNFPFPLYEIGEHFTTSQALAALSLQLAATMMIAYLALSLSLHRNFLRKAE
ncbi:MAG: ATP-binding cassette domain-containing protein [Proteobacteria bacterium]|nr:ATP-binding cassette domain-containing protein [Pseudomonadota bacterium]